MTTPIRESHAEHVSRSPMNSRPQTQRFTTAGWPLVCSIEGYWPLVIPIGVACATGPRWKRPFRRKSGLRFGMRRWAFNGPFPPWTGVWRAEFPSNFQPGTRQSTARRRAAWDRAAAARHGRARCRVAGRGVRSCGPSETRHHDGHREYHPAQRAQALLASPCEIDHSNYPCSCSESPGSATPLDVVRPLRRTDPPCEPYSGTVQAILKKKQGAVLPVNQKTAVSRPGTGSFRRGGLAVIATPGTAATAGMVLD